MPTIKVNEATAGAREINLVLVQDSDGKTPVTSFTFAAGDLRIKKQGGAWANAGGSNPVHTEDGVWTYQLTAGEVDTLGELLVKFNKATIRLFDRTIDIVAYQPRDAAALGLTNLDATVSSRASSAALATVQADTDDIQTRLPAALVSGRMDSSVGAMAANVITAAAINAAAITAAKFATDAIDANALAATAVTEIQSGLATSAALATVQADTDDIQSRLPAALVAGRIDASVGAMAANVITAAAINAAAITAAKFATDAVDANALAATAVTEIQAGLATSASQTTIVNAIAVVQADTDDIQGRLPATLNAGNMRASVEVMQANTVNANAIAADAGTELAAAVDVTLTAAHGAGAWNGAGGGGDPNAVLQALLIPNAVDGSLAKGLLTVMARLNGNMQIDQYVYVDGRPTSMRIRAFTNETDANAGTNPIDTARVTVVNGPNGPTSYKAVHEP